MLIQKQNNFTRGNQLYAHKVRMWLQGIKNAFKVGIICAVLWIIIRMCMHLSIRDIYYFCIERWCQLQMLLFKLNIIQSSPIVKFYYFEQGQYVYRPCMKFIYHFWYVAGNGKHILKFWHWLINNALFEMLIALVVSMSSVVWFFQIKGRGVIGNVKLRGGDIVEVTTLRRQLIRDKANSNIVIGGLPLVKNSETKHILLTGTTGSGKTNLLNELLPQIRNNESCAIIVDPTNTFVKTFYDPKTDVILNPFDVRSAHWLPWNDCITLSDYDALAKAFFDGDSLHDPYWETSAKQLFSSALLKVKEKPDIKKLLQILQQKSLKDFCTFFADTSAAGLASIEGDKTTASIRSTLVNKVNCLKYLNANGKFSINQWLEQKSGWLFITFAPAERETLKPLVSAWLDIAITALMRRDTLTNNDKVWVIVDELPALKKVPSLKTALSEGRKYGMCFVATIQNIFQMESIYGHAEACGLLDMFNTKYFFRVGDGKTADFASRSLGTKEIFETRESLSYGANSMRDGVNINSIEQNKSLVLPSELMTLKSLECFVKLAEHYPIAKLKMEHTNNKLINQPSH